MEQNKVLALLQVDFFSDLTKEEIVGLAEEFRWKSCEQGEIIIPQGVEDHPFFVVVEGAVEAVVTKGELEPVRINTFTAGDSFGKISLCLNEPAPTTIRALVNCEFLYLERQSFLQLMVRWPILYKKLAERLSRHVNNVNLGLWDARQKEFLRSTLYLNEIEKRFYKVWGGPKSTKVMNEVIEEISQQKNHVILYGERGTGRQMLAWAIHKKRFGPSAPFVIVEGNQLERYLAEMDRELSELACSLPDASLSDGGLLKMVEGGTLFVQDMNEVTPFQQRKLARILSSDQSNFVVTASILAAQEKMPALSVLLESELAPFFTFTYSLPAIRQRKRDLPFLVKGILQELAERQQRSAPAVSNEAMKLLLSHNYRQGNVTELAQVIERAFLLADGMTIDLEHVFFGPTAKKAGGSFNLLSLPFLADLIKSGHLVTRLRQVIGALFLVLLVLLLAQPHWAVQAGFFLFAWGLWWPLIALLSPIIGRIWCTFCPVSTMMEAIQKVHAYQLPVPVWLKKYDYLVVTAFFLIIFWLEITFALRYEPFFTGLLLIFLLLMALVVALFYYRHAWCRHLCPLGGFIGLASLSSIVEVRAETSLCLNQCTTYDCYKGKGDVAGCPMSQHLAYLDNNIDCKVCLNCLRNCPNDAVELNIRMPGRELWQLVRINQGYVIFVAVLSAILVPVFYYDAFLPSIARFDDWLFFTLLYWSSALLFGLLAYRVVKPYRTKGATKRVQWVFALVPLIFSGHIVYHLNYVPGMEKLLLAMATVDGENLQTFYVSALQASQWLVIGAGLFFTLLFVWLVQLRSIAKV
ncbi:cyclic nucleotide-binding domain-containing protein [Heliorestis acidaminivorans]|uniref:Cyclic nucleotide-binding domain-containing protein n=1 Tax=Heliorestis acidaminivorans TaxID=553427 RepID=A0A6I0ERI9_9FIRM|nr:cyclic nucleotide-binding domain-containing protein [Heliorestis acidaminivorans]KAB2952979.1 cyclic nucleotide-binding domain-containing protein [Heliorestis acidaminivorans]